MALSTIESILHKKQSTLQWQKNQLGFMAKEDTFTNQILIKVPRDLLLTTRDAYLSDIKKVFQENSYYFHESCCNSWEDHMLLFYILYEWQKERNSEWYHLIRNLPKELDYVVFWKEEEILKLQDRSFIKMVHQARREFDLEYAETKKIMKKYPQLFDAKCYAYENVRWIYTHLVTRCFGKFLKYVTMVPLVEMLNHECSDVYYDFDYLKNNPKTPKGLDETKKLTDRELEDCQTSEGSQNSKDMISDEDFDYTDEFFDLERRCFDAQTIQTRENRNKLSDTYKFIRQSIDLGF